MLALGKLRLDDHGKSLHKLFGINGMGASFSCDCCHKVVGGLPVRKGLDDNLWFCSAPCAWLYYKDADQLIKWIGLMGTRDDEFTRAVWSFLDRATAPKNSMEV